MIDDPLTTCPECGNHIRRVLYPAGVVFKGSGFYKTDYSNNKPLPSTNGETKKAGSSTESKPASESTSATSASSKSETSASSTASSSSSASTASAPSK
jgi:predicted nucleic acid-binding Zn ribbon protein